MSDPILPQVGSDENEPFYSSFSPREVNEESAPSGRNMCLTDPQRLEKTVLLHNANVVTQQKQPYVELRVLSNPVQLLYLGNSLQLCPVTPQVPGNQPLVSSSGGNAESTASVLIPSADTSETGNQELGVTPEDASSAGHASVRRRKKCLWEMTEPFSDPVKEKKRKAAIKARNNRVKKEENIAHLELELKQTKEKLATETQSLADARQENQILKALLQAALSGMPTEVFYAGNQFPQN